MMETIRNQGTSIKRASRKKGQNNSNKVDGGKKGKLQIKNELSLKEAILE